ncbi:MAG: hypothetical protein IJ344_03370 [Clostridia bacterium]|nr:hypothetical protein [Clostridia bacterium]
MKKRIVAVLLALLCVLCSSCVYPFMYYGVLPEGMEEEKLFSCAEQMISLMAQGKFDDLEEHADGLDVKDLKKEYEKITKTAGAYKSCVFLEYYGDEESVYIYYNCNHMYAQVEYTLTFDSSYKLTEVTLWLNEKTVKDPNLQQM